MSWAALRLVLSPADSGCESLVRWRKDASFQLLQPTLWARAPARRSTLESSPAHFRGPGLEPALSSHSESSDVGPPRRMIRPRVGIRLTPGPQLRLHQVSIQSVGRESDDGGRIAPVAPRRCRPRERLVVKPLTPLVARRSSREFTRERQLAEGSLHSCSRQRAELLESETPSINQCRERRTAPDARRPQAKPAIHFRRQFTTRRSREDG